MKSKWDNFDFSGKKRLVLCGQTGDGKSTLINALIEVDVLPVAAEGSACTLTTIEVLANTRDDLYRAEVEFLNREECKVVLESMQSWLHDEGLSASNAQKKLKAC